MEKFERDFLDSDSLEIDDVLDRTFFSSQPDDMPDLEDDDVIFTDD